MLDGTLFFVKSARYGKPDKDFVRLFISIPVHFTTSRQLSKTAFWIPLEHISIHMKKTPILSIKRGIFIIFNQNTPFYFIRCKFLIFPMN